MNREIKFRAWDIDSSEMLYTDKDNNRNDFFFSFSEGYFELYLSVENDYPDNRNIKLMQSSGIKDIDGISIYEGDLIKGYGNDAHEVIFADGAYYLKKNNSSIRLSRTCGALKIIGNIYENPELL